MVEVLYEDNHLIFVNKEAGVLTQPSPTEPQSLESEVKHSLKQKYNKPGNVFLHALHRLDKQASGIVLFAKTSKALSRMNEAMRQGKIKKWYIAECEGTFTEKKGTLTSFLVHDDHKAKVVSEHTPQAKKSILHYEVLHEENNLSLLRIELSTGRYHQIRAQLAAYGHPIIGDTKYGSHIPCQSLPCQPQVIHLHHTRMQIPHPVTGEPLLVESLPPHFWHFSKTKK